ncbi:MAG: hypothetical protein KDB82_08465 [Planctomycetes bacterium]|nr:hypothetical protein [Planctomycetota bacterium]
MSATTLDEPEKFSFPMMVKMGSLGAFLLGLIVFGLSFIGGADLAFGGWAIAAWYVVGFPLFAMFFLSINHLSAAGWHVTMKRVPEAMTRYFIPGAVTIAVLFLSFLFKEHQLYGWAHPPEDHSEHAELIHHKAPWLNVGFFVIRWAIYFGLWTAFGWAMVRASRKQDEDGELKHTFTGRKLAAPFCIIFGLTVTFSSIDYIKSVEPTWFSTMFGVYQFGGIIESGFAMLILLVLLLRKTGYLKTAVNENHLHNLGIWLFAAATFWAYVWFSQFMLIWYSNLPEETAHFMARWNGPWFWVSFALSPIVNWLVVFLLLLPRPNKRNPKILAIAACFALVGRFIDLWQFVTPTPHPGADGVPEAHWLPQETFWQAGVVVGLMGLFVFITLTALEKAPLLAKKDPFFEESVHHHI